jgi:ABC-2 type transport system permease protein
VNARAIRAQIRAELILTLRRGESLLVTLVIPLGVLLFFAKLDAAIPKRYDEPVDFLVPGVMALAVMSSAMVSLAIATGFERRYGVLKRLGATPLGRPGLVIAKTATVLLIELLQFTFIVGVGAALGWSVGFSLLPAVAIVLVGSIAFAGVAMSLAGTLRAEATLAIANALFLVLMFLGGMAYPIDKLPAVLQSLADILPAAALSECLRGVLVDGFGFPIGSFVVLVVWAVGAPVVAVRTFRWEE